MLCRRRCGRRTGTLALKRQISVEEGRLRYAVDSSSSVRDEVLATVLRRSSDAKMHDIVSSIQREQNAVIRYEEPGTLIIQGVAGSGKTSIALHRVAYLLYRQKERLNSRSVAILSPSRVFSDYISGVLPELGEEPVRQWCLYDLAAMLLGGVAKVAPPRSAADEADPARAARAQAKGTEAFAASLTAASAFLKPSARISPAPTAMLPLLPATASPVRASPKSTPRIILDILPPRSVPPQPRSQRS